MANSFQFLIDSGNYKAVIDGCGKTQTLSVSTFMNTVFSDNRDWFTTSAGQRLPTKRGVNLTVDEWLTICERRESVCDAILKWHCHLFAAPTPVLDAASEVAQVLLSINDNLKISVVPVFRTSCEKDGLWTAAKTADVAKKMAVSITPLT